MTREEAIQELEFILVGHPTTSARGKAVLMAIETLAKMEAIQEIIDMPALWEQDDRRRYAKIVDIIRKDSRIKIDISSDVKEKDRWNIPSAYPPNSILWEDDK